MKTSHLVAAFVVLWAWERYNKQNAVQPYDAAFKQAMSNFQAMEGTNFTQSLWDPVNAQPSYMFGAVPIPGGDGINGTPSFSGAFGAM